jgi:hypothetical protein
MDEPGGFNLNWTRKRCAINAPPGGGHGLPSPPRFTPRAAAAGEAAKARTACQDFLTLWKDADADIPILKRAKAEYAKLHRLLADAVTRFPRTCAWGWVGYYLGANG